MFIASVGGGVLIGSGRGSGQVVGVWTDEAVGVSGSCRM